MPDFAFETVDVFTTARFGGNPLAVFPDAGGIPEGDMQRIAREFNLSETTFVLPPADPAHTARVRIFTPQHEVPFAGHPNVGTALVLAARAVERGPGRPDHMAFEEEAGLVRIAFDWSGPHGRATLDAPRPLTVGQALPPEVIAACTGLRPEDVLTTLHPPVVADVGNLFTFTEVTPEALARAKPDTAAIAAAAERFKVKSLGFPVHLHAALPGGRRRTRMFAPLSGIMEDPATGSANVALVALLLSLGTDDALALEIEQGVEMGRPSLLHAAARRAPDGIRATVGGSAVPVLRGTISL